VESLGPAVGYLAQAFVPPIEVQTKDAMGPAHVAGEGGKTIFDLTGLMAMVAHKGIRENGEVISGASLLVILVYATQVGMFFAMALQ